MKSKIQYFLQRLLGFQRYLFWFSIYKIRTLKWDKGEKDFFKFVQLLNNTDTVLDIGANIGIMTAHLAKTVKEGKVLCFEPMPDNILTLREIVEHFRLSNVEIFEIALGNENGDIEMVMPIVDNVRKQGLSHVVHDELNDFNEGNRIKVPLYKLDTLLSNNDSKIQAIKIDVENFEYYVFLGAKNILMKHKPMIYCELWDNENRKRCFNFLLGLGYQIKILKGSSLVEFDPQTDQTQNFFFV